MNAVPNGFESSPLTTRIAVVDRVAAEWLTSHPEIPVTAANLSKTLQQMLTGVFLTGQQRGRRNLSLYAESLIHAAAVDAKEVASARTFSKSADLPACYAAVFAKLSTLLAPLAAAVQLSRSAVADAAFALVKRSGAQLGITRLGLRGFVEGQVRPHALRIHERVGYHRSAHDYVRLVLEHTDQLANEVVGAATRKASQSPRLSDQSQAGFEKCFRAYGAEVLAEAERYSSDPDELFSRTIQKLAIAYRNNPDLEADLAYCERVLKNVWFSFQKERASRPVVVSDEPERANSREPIQDASCDEIAGIDAIVRRLLGVAESLSESAAPEGTLASELLVNYFFVDPTVYDPRHAELADRIWELADAENSSELEKGLCELARKLFSCGASVQQIVKMVIKALRRGKDQ